MMAETGATAEAVGAGTGKDGRITKGDVLDYLARPGTGRRRRRRAEGGRARWKKARNA